MILLEGRVLLDGPTRQVLAAADPMAQARLVPPAVTQLSRALGFAALAPEEFRREVCEESVLGLRTATKLLMLG